MVTKASNHSSIRFPRKGIWEYAAQDGVTVSTYGIPEEFRRAFLSIIVETRKFYRRLLGRQTIGAVELNVQRRPSAELRLWTNGADRIYLQLRHGSQLQPAKRSGIRHLHGLAHELAHIALYRSIINIPLLGPGWGEGWAIYLGSFWGVPHLFDVFGTNAWPYPHDYLATDGPEYYLRAFSRVSWQPRNTAESVVYDLYRWEKYVGRVECAGYLRQLLKSPLRADDFNRQMNSTIKNAVGCRARIIPPKTRRA